MTGQGNIIADADDPLPQLLMESSLLSGSGQTVVCSQTAALTHWPQITHRPGPVAIILRRHRLETSDEVALQLNLLQKMVRQSGQPFQFLALTDPAAVHLSVEMDLTVTALPAMPCHYSGGRRLQIVQANELLLRHNENEMPLRHFNLARLRQVAVLGTDTEASDLADLAEYANGASPQTPLPSDTPVIVMVCSNGFGLGHVTRMLAVAQALRQQHGARILFWSFSRAGDVMSRYGFEVIARHTASHLGAEQSLWHKWEVAEFAAILKDLKPAMVVQDASNLDRFIMDALAKPGTGSARLALIRRGMWQTQSLGTDLLDAENHVDMVVEPGDLAASADRGLTRGRAGRSGSFAQMALSAPVTLTKPEELMPRRQARKALGLGRGGHCLVSLGGNAMNDWSVQLRKIMQAADEARIRLVWARSPLAGPEPEIDEAANITVCNLYPLAPYLKAFDGVVSASGYNSFHELMQLYDGPVLFCPRQHAALDDQAARARFAADQGWARVLEAEHNPDAEVAAFFREVVRGLTVTGRPGWQDGAREMASHLAGLAALKEAAQ